MKWESSAGQSNYFTVCWEVWPSLLSWGLCKNSSEKKDNWTKSFSSILLGLLYLGVLGVGGCLFFRRILIGCLFCVCVCLDVLLVLFHPLPPPRENSIGGLNHSSEKDKFHFYKPACSESSCWHTKLAWQKFDSNHSLYYWDDIISDFVRKKKSLNGCINLINGKTVALICTWFNSRYSVNKEMALLQDRYQIIDI